MARKKNTEAPVTEEVKTQDPTVTSETPVISNEESVKKVELGKIPTCVINARFVSVLLGQGLDADVSAMPVSYTHLTK